MVIVFGWALSDSEDNNIDVTVGEKWEPWVELSFVIQTCFSHGDKTTDWRHWRRVCSQSNSSGCLIKMFTFVSTTFFI